MKTNNYLLKLMGLLMLILLFSNILKAQQKNDSVYLIVDEYPRPNRGFNELYKYVKQNLKYPTRACIQGRVLVSFIVNEEGTLYNFSILKSLGAGEAVDEAAIDVIKNYPAKWTPGYLNGKEVKVRMTLPIHFRLNAANNTEFKKEINPKSIQLPPPPPSKLREDEFYIFVSIPQAKPKEGLAEFYKYIKQNLQYPKTAQKLGLEGKVFVQFVIARDGKLKDFKVLRTFDGECGQAAIRVLTNYPDVWIPERHRGKAVESKIAIPILFKIDNKQIQKDKVLSMKVFPNPATDQVNISFNTAQKSSVKISAYNTTNHRQMMVLSEEYEAGRHSFNWETYNLPEGTYILTITIGKEKMWRIVFVE